MVKTQVNLHRVAGAAVVPLADRFARIRRDHGISEDYPEPALEQARQAATGWRWDGRADRTDVPFVTLDPAGSTDLDQAMFLQATGSGYRVRYAIADVPAFVAPGGPLDQETRRRGVTIYCPDRRVPLHPRLLSEGAASLLPGQDRPAFIWDLTLDTDGQVVRTGLERAVVRSRAQLDYAGAQRDLDAGRGHDQLALLGRIGTLRIAQEEARGGASLPMPEQEIHSTPDGRYRLTFRPPSACEEWNAQISLMTGMAAAQVMLDAGLGVLRTMPPAGDAAVDQLRRQANSLGVSWPRHVRYGDFLRGLDRTDPRQLAVIHQATRLFRGAAYTAFDGTVPQAVEHAAVAAPYAHVTAPLRRLVDRFGLELCHAVLADAPVPDWVREALPAAPGEMAAADRVAGQVDRACLDTVEAALLAGRVGERMRVDVVEENHTGLLVQLSDPAILAHATGSAPLGSVVEATLVRADIETGTVQFHIGR